MEFVDSYSTERSESFNAGTSNGGRSRRSAHKAERVLKLREVEQDGKEGFVMRPKSPSPPSFLPNGSGTAGEPPHMHVESPPAAPTPEDEKPRDLDVWKRTKEEEERLYRILNGPIPSPAPSPTFVWPPTEAEEAVMQQVLYGPRRGRRLPAFSHVCPDEY